MSKRKKPSATDKGEELLRRALKAAPHATPELIEAIQHAPPTMAEVQQVQQQALAMLATTADASCKGGLWLQR